MIFRLLHLILVAIVVVAAQPSSHAMAQAIGQGSLQLIADQTKVIQDLTAKTDGLEKKISDPGEDDAGLVDIRLQLEDISRAALNSALAFRSRLNDINNRIEVLGPAPAQGQQEPAIVANERAALTAEKAEINAVVAGAQNLSIRISGLVDRIATMRSELFRSVLTKRYELTEALSPQAFSDAHDQLTSLYKAVASWLTFAFKFKFQAILAATLMALVLAAVLMIGGRRLFGRIFEADPSEEDPSYLSRLSVAFWSTLLPTAALGVFFVAAVFFFNYYNVLRGDIGTFLNALLAVIGVVFCVNRLTNAALEPRLPTWRLIPVETGPARWLVRLATAMAVVLDEPLVAGIIFLVGRREPHCRAEGRRVVLRQGNPPDLGRARLQVKHRASRTRGSASARRRRRGRGAGTTRPAIPARQTRTADQSAAHRT